MKSDAGRAERGGIKRQERVMACKHMKAGNPPSSLAKDAMTTPTGQENLHAGSLIAKDVTLKKLKPKPKALREIAKGWRVASVERL